MMCFLFRIMIVCLLNLFVCCLWSLAMFHWSFRGYHLGHIRYTIDAISSFILLLAGAGSYFKSRREYLNFR